MIAVVDLFVFVFSFLVPDGVFSGWTLRISIYMFIFNVYMFYIMFIYSIYIYNRS